MERKQVKTHRKRRINKKWAKRYGFTYAPSKSIYQMGDKLVMHPTMAATLRKKMK